jgi:hypothetical protein
VTTKSHQVAHTHTLSRTRAQAGTQGTTHCQGWEGEAFTRQRARRRSWLAISRERERDRDEARETRSTTHEASPGTRLLDVRLEKAVDTLGTRAERPVLSIVSPKRLGLPDPYRLTG